MKRLVLFLVSALLLAILPAFAQEAPVPGIKVTTLLREGGGRTETKTDFENRTGEAKTYDSKNKLIQRSTFTLDAQDRVAEETVYNPKDEVMGIVTFLYDAQGRRSEEFQKSPKGVLLRRLVYHFNAAGRVSGIDIYDGQGKLIQAAPTPRASKSGRSGR